jgi:hypothetical protein
MMNQEETIRTVAMALVNHGETLTVAKNDMAAGEFAFSLQPRYNPARTVQFALQPADAEALHKALTVYLKGARKAQ